MLKQPIVKPIILNGVIFSFNNIILNPVVINTPDTDDNGAEYDKSCVFNMCI